LGIAPAAEAGMDMRGAWVMRTRYCLKHQLGLCGRDKGQPPLQEALYLVDEEGRRYRRRGHEALCYNLVSHRSLRLNWRAVNATTATMYNPA
jgi:hypothetical protein